MPAQMLFFDKPRLSSLTQQHRREPHGLEIEILRRGHHRIDKHLALPRHHLIFDSPTPALSIFKRANGPGGDFFQKRNPHPGGHHAHERALRVENRGRKGNGIDTAVRLMGCHIGHVQLSRLTRGHKPWGLAIVMPCQRRLCRRHNRTLTICDREPQIDRGIGSLHPLQILGEIARIRRAQRKGAGHHEGVALSLEQHSIGFLGHFRRGECELFPCRHDQARLNELNQPGAGHKREQGHGNNEIGQPAIAAKIEE